MPKPRAVILTGHFPIQKRRGNILWLSDNLRADGWHVTMVTTGYSWVSKLRGDRRFQQLETGSPTVGEVVHDDSLTSFFAFSPLHPFSVRKPLIDELLRPLHQSFPWFWARRLPRYLRGADLVVIESGPQVMLAPMVRRMAPDAAMVYRVSDDIKVHGVPGFLARAEMKHAPLFDRISVASKFLARRFSHLGSLRIDPMGVAKDVLDGDLPDPFPARVPGKRQAVCSGTTQFDADSMRMMAELRPDWTFHILGRLRSVPADAPPNLVFHGEVPFSTAAAFVKHADFGLAPYLDKPGVEYQTAQSNRMLIYRYYGLPMAGPARICDPDVPGLVGYTPGSRDSMAGALDKLATMERTPSDPSVQDWSVLCERIVSTPKPA
ncbi:GumK N-terminal domain-containing glycosyltransferase [Leisingera thetidis]|uniref:GumK N-terminal domain-containing glycosyltransferase n=1 Tax=Leisingera thetidis TaxID=2930199 RepID=UPI0021F775C2|nr:hypothetical protein [Leisingera thetidis]